MSDDLVIEGLGVRLSRLTFADIQLVRQWRNAASVSRYMHFREQISEQQQERWFASLDPQCDYYFIVEYQGEKVGLSSLKGVDLQARTGEGGLFLVPETLRNSDIAYRASLPALDWIYDDLKLSRVTTTMTVDNRRALRFNRSLGHMVDESASGEKAIRTYQTRESWREARANLVRVFGEWR